MANKQKQTASQSNANALTASTNAASDSKIQASMEEYGTYTATSDAHNEYPPKTSSNMNTTAQSSAMPNSTTDSMAASTQSANTQPNGMSTGAQSAHNQAPTSKTGTTLTAQYDANNQP